MSRVEYASKPVPVFTKLAVLLRNIPAMQFVLTKLAALLGRNKTQTLPLDTKFLGESPEVTEKSDKSADQKTAVVEPADGDAIAVPRSTELLGETPKRVESSDKCLDQPIAIVEPSDADAIAAPPATDPSDQESFAVPLDAESLDENPEVTGNLDESADQQTAVVEPSDVGTIAAPVAIDQSDSEALTISPDTEFLGETPEVTGSLDQSAYQQTAMVEPSDASTASLVIDQADASPDTEFPDETPEITRSQDESTDQQTAIVEPPDVDAIAASQEEEERESLIRRRWAETGIKMWNPDVHGAGLAALGIQGRVGLLQPESGETLPRHDRLEFKLIEGRIVCEGFVVDPPKSRRRSLTL
jgi:hypothetical protein